MESDIIHPLYRLNPLLRSVDRLPCSAIFDLYFGSRNKNNKTAKWKIYEQKGKKNIKVKIGLQGQTLQKTVLCKESRF